MKFSSSDIEFLKENYPIHGPSFCAIELKRTKISISNKACSLGLKLDKKELSRLLKKAKAKTDEEYKVNPSIFIDPKTPEVCYVLGLLWADGYLSKRSKGIYLQCVKEDVDIFMPVFLKTGNWASNTRKIGHWKRTVTINTHNERIHDFLSQNDYLSKSSSSACKILSIIPDHLKKYWFRGLIDGDGCFYINRKNNSCARVVISSSLYQDWTYLSNLFNSLGLTFTIAKINAKNGSSSLFQMCGKSKIKQFCDYLYDGYKDDLIGLPRKFESAMYILNSMKRKFSPKLRKSIVSKFYIRENSFESRKQNNYE